MIEYIFVFAHRYHTMSTNQATFEYTKAEKSIYPYKFDNKMKISIISDAKQLQQ